mmetsp:Transcript_39334/g.60127  ORF Transcript_39334/g.60127 Transcript_39334/m.60127 type:complete len:102 (-) Transcript_39334:5335-5640(-)
MELLASIKAKRTLPNDGLQFGKIDTVISHIYPDEKWSEEIEKVLGPEKRRFIGSSPGKGCLTFIRNILELISIVKTVDLESYRRLLKKFLDDNSFLGVKAL